MTTLSMMATVRRGEAELEVEVEGEMVPYRAGTHYDPPEGGYVEDVQAYLAGKKFGLTDEEEKWFAEQLCESYDPADFEPDYEPPEDFD